MTFVETPDEVRSFLTWLGQRRGHLAVDTETAGLDWWRHPCRLAQIGDPTAGWAFRMPDWRGLVRWVIENYEGPMAFHNAKFDAHALREQGIHVPRHLVHDTIAIAAVLEPHKYMKLESVAARHHPIGNAAYFAQDRLRNVFATHKWNWDTVPVDHPAYWEYACQDVILCSWLADTLVPKVYADENLRRVYDVEVAASWVITDMERRGLLVDQEYCRHESARMRGYQDQLRTWCKEHYGLDNPGSDKQVIKRLQDDGVQFTVLTEKGNISLTEDVLRTIHHPLAEVVVNYRKADKKAGTYFESWLEYSDAESRIHTSLNVTGARTGRMSSERPNLQNVPRARSLRWPLTVREGHKLVLVDYDQIELRIMAHEAQEPEWIAACRAGEDLHAVVGRLIYGREITKRERDIVKRANFAKIYGAGIPKFAMTAGIGIEEARDFMSRYEARFPGVRRFMDEVSQRARDAAAVDSEGLARLTAPYLGRQQIAKPSDAYKLVNYLIQGTAADVLKQRLVYLGNTEAGRYVSLPIHDEFAFEVPEEHVEDVVREAVAVLEEREGFSVPLTVGAEVVTRWGEKYDEG